MMTRGKETCKILKDIRMQIAQANDIELVISECKHKGECAGTCPKCEAEVRYLENQLSVRQAAGKPISIRGMVAGIATVAALSMTSCATVGDVPNPEIQGNILPPDSVPLPSDTTEQSRNFLEGELI